MTEPTTAGGTRSSPEIELEDDLDEELEPAIDDFRVPPELRAGLAKGRVSKATVAAP